MALLSLTPSTYLLLFVALAIGLTIRSRRAPAITRNGQKLKKPAGTLPLVGNGLVFLQARQKLFAWFTACARQHGSETVAISVPSLPPGVVVHDARVLDYVLRREGDVFAKGPFFTDRAADLFGHGIINVDGALWRTQRKAGLRFLSRENLHVLLGVELPRLLRGCVQDLSDGSRERKGAAGVDLQTVFHELTTQLMGRMAYNMEMHAGDAFTRAFEHASGVTAERFQNPVWFVTELLTGAAMRRSLATVKAHGRRIVTSAVRDRKQHKDDDVAGSLVQSLLDAIGDEDIVADAALNYLSAGRDTVSQALTWTFYLLMRHPRVVDRLRDAIRAATPADIVLPSTDIPYALAVFYESLRLHPPIPFEIKQAQQATTLPDGTSLPRGAIVVWCAWALNRAPETWGPDADAFRPERWLDDAGRFVARSAAEFPVFNGGPRLCLGKTMAETMAVQVLATLVRRFDFAPAFEGKRVSRSSLTLPMEGGLPVYVTERDTSLDKESTGNI